MHRFFTKIILLLLLGAIIAASSAEVSDSLFDISTENLVVSNDGQCVRASCYDSMSLSSGVSTTNGFVTKTLTAVDPRDSRIVRACSCTSFCSLYGDCCEDTLQFSRSYVDRFVERQSAIVKLQNKDDEGEILTQQSLRELLKPKCRELSIGRQNLANEFESFINVQIATECDACTENLEEVTQYFGVNKSEITRRLPVYYDGLGVVFSNMECARCYQNVLEMSRVRPLPLTVNCNNSVDIDQIYSGSLKEDGNSTTICIYSLNITQLQAFSKLAICLPMIVDEAMQEAFVCGHVGAADRTFKACTADDPVTNVLYDDEGNIYKFCTKNSSNKVCGERETTVLYESSGYSSIQPKRKCVKEGNIITPTSVRTLSGAQAFVHRMQRSDFSYRYMFDLQKLATAEEILGKRAGICKGTRKEIFIERWQICVRRDAGDITIGIRPALPAPSSPSDFSGPSNDWLDFSENVYTVEQEKEGNTTLNVLKLMNNNNLKLDTSCFRWLPLTGQFLVSHPCLCEIFRRSFSADYNNDNEPFASQSIIPRDDDILSLAGSLSIWLSIVCLLAVIAILAAFPKLRNRPAKLVMLLSTFLCIGMAMVLVNIYANVSVVRPRHRQEPTYEEDCLRSPPLKEAACNLIGLTLHFSYLATFALASSLYIDLWRSVRKITAPGSGDDSQTRFWLLAGPSCLIPMMIVLTAIVIDQMMPDSEFAPRYAEFICWISTPKALFVFFVCPVVVALVVDIVLFILIARQIRANTFRPIVDKTTASTSSTSVMKLDQTTKKRRREEKRKKYLRQLSIYAKMALMMGLTWLLGCIAPFVPDTYGFAVALWYGFVVLNGLQGVFIFYTYVVSKKTWQVIRETWQGGSQYPGSSQQQHGTRYTTTNRQPPPPYKKSASDSRLLNKK